MTKQIDYKPWLIYPHIWKTEAAFWAYVRGALRRGLWEKSPIKLEYKNSQCNTPPKGYTGKAKTGTHCALTGKWTGKSKLEVDHIEGNAPLKSWEDVLPFVLHLIPDRGMMQLVEKEAHKVKSYAERQGMTFEEALTEKKVIAIMKEKSVKEQKDELKSFGFTDEDIKNDKARRLCYRKHYSQ